MDEVAVIGRNAARDEHAEGLAAAAEFAPFRAKRVAMSSSHAEGLSVARRLGPRLPLRARVLTRLP